MAETATTAKTTRNKGPIAITYVGADGSVSRRLPDVVTAVRVTDNQGKHEDYPLAKLVAPMLTRFGAAGLAVRFKATAVHGGDPSKVLADTRDLFEDFVNGKMYTRAESGPRKAKGFSEDKITMIVEAFKLAHTEIHTRKLKDKVSGKLLAPEPVAQLTLDDLRNKLATETKEKRTAMMASLKGNSLFTKHFAALEAKAKAKGADATVEALLF